MPLTEISPNLRRSGSEAKPLHAKRQDGDSHKALDLTTPSAVQSMLKTATEIGDIGQFAVKTSRLPRSGSRVRDICPRSPSFDTSFASALRHHTSPPLPHHSRRHHGPRPTPSLPGMSGHNDTTYSNPPPYREGLRSKARGYRQLPHSFEGLARPPPGSHRLYTHRSLMTLRSHRDYGSMHSASPMPFPARLRTPGYRANSPAFGDAQSYRTYSRPLNHHVGSSGTAASSPRSMFHAQQTALGYHPGMNSSFCSAIRLPSPAIAPSHYGGLHSQYPSRTTTPLSQSFQDPGVASVTSNASGPGLPKSPTGSTIPAYYDYTESYVEEECCSPGLDVSHVSLPFNMDQTILENGPPANFRHAQTPFGTMPGSTFYPSELPTKHNRRPSEQSNGSCPIVIPRRTSSLAASIVSQEHESKEQVKFATKPPCELSRQYDAEPDLRRASVASRRTCVSSHSSLFFPSASRSPRDLASLAARVHSPSCEKGGQKCLPPAEIVPRIASNSHLNEVTGIADGAALTSWRMSSLSFRPWSFAPRNQTDVGRPRSSGHAIVRTCLEIVSPTPQRPMSSQSRKRFSRILEVDDIWPSGNESSCSFGKAYSSLSFSRLKRLEEILEHSYPPRFSIPPYRPRNNEDAKENPGSEILDAYADNRSTQSASREKSTVESFLDNHIECLGLLPDRGGPEQTGSSDLLHKATSTCIKTTPQRSDVTPAIARDEPRRPATSRSWKYSSITSVDQRALLPRRSFSSMDLTSHGHLIEQKTGLVKDGNDLISLGWQTIASTVPSDPVLSLSKPSILSGELADMSSEGDPKKFIMKSRSGLYSTDYTVYRDEDADIRREARDAAQVHKRLRENVDRRTAERRKIRARLKMKRNSLSYGQLSSPSKASPGQSFRYQGSISEHDSTVIANNVATDAGAWAELTADQVSLLSLQSSEFEAHSSGPVLAEAGAVPDRWSSIIAAMPEPVKKNVEVAGEAPMLPSRPNPTNTSLVKTGHDAGLGLQTPRPPDAIAGLSRPDFGPPLPTSNLDLNTSYVDAPSTIRPSLRGTKSFFSDESSAMWEQRAGVKKAFRLSSLRNVLHSSSRGKKQGMIESPTGTNRSKLHHSCQKVGRKPSEPEIAFSGTVGMSDFAYRKKKVLDKLKEWWRKHCKQKSFASLKRKGDKGATLGA